jgi:hypothetical protein
MSVKASGGFRELDPKLMEQAIDRSLTTVGILLEGEVIARANENVDTGRHKGSITWKVKGGGSEIAPDSTGQVKPEDEQSAPAAEHEVHVGTAVHYAPHLEYGHQVPGGGKAKAYPHFRSAFDENQKRVKHLFSKALKGFIQHAKKHS